MKQIEIFQEMLEEAPCKLTWPKKVIDKKGLSLKPYFQRRNLSEEEIKQAKENSERTRKKLEKMGVFGI